MKMRFAALGTTILFAFGFALTAQVKDHTTQPDRFFLTEDQVANSELLLPPPPADTSKYFAYDIDCYYKGKALRDTPRGDQAAQDAKVDAIGVANAFSEAFGVDITPEGTPEIYRLVTGMREDAGDLSTRSAKNKYMRVRPFVYFNEQTCAPEDQATLSKNGSYPSGHTAIGWAAALVLAELNPARQNEILKRGYEIGQSRVICGYHFQSDVDAARIVASGVVARLHADPGFQEQLAKAKQEMATLISQGVVNN